MTAKILNGLTAAQRKRVPLATGCLDYFPDALLAVAAVSFIGNEQHNPGTALHWDRSKSQDEADTMLRHFTQRGTLDTDGVPHSAKMAWRALALLQKELEEQCTPSSQEIVELLKRSNSVLAHMWFIKKGRLPKGRKRTTIRTGLPTVAWRKLK